MNECLNLNGIIPFLIQGRGQIHIRRRPPLANRSGVQDQHLRPRPTDDRERGEGRRLGEQGTAREARAQRELPIGVIQRGTEMIPNDRLIHWHYLYPFDTEGEVT